MGLPQINITFQSKAITAIQRSEKGIVALILKDDTDTSFTTKEYTSVDEVETNDWTANNYKYIQQTLLGIPKKVIVERVGTGDGNLNAATNRLKNKFFNYVACPGAIQSDQTGLSTWVKNERTNNHKPFKAVVSDSVAPDSEGVINFQTNDIKVDSDTFTALQYTGRIAGILAGLPFTRSATYYELPEVESITESGDPTSDINMGKLILINDGEKIKIARGVNSLTTFTSTKGKVFSKIKIMEAVDLITEDIRSTFKDNYVGKVLNSYDNKQLFVSAINGYFAGLEREFVLDGSQQNNNFAEVDLEAQRTYLKAKGLDVENMTEEQIKKANTDDEVFVKSQNVILDAMEQLTMDIFI